MRQPVRHRVLAGVVVALTGAAAWSMIASLVAVRDHRRDAQRDQARVTRLEAVHEATWRASRRPGDRDALDGVDPADRAWEWHYLDARRREASEPPADDTMVLDGGDGPVHLAFTTGGPLLVTASRGGVVRVWDPATGEPVATLARLDGPAADVAVSPAGRIVAAIDGVSGVRLWDAAGVPLRAGCFRDAARLAFAGEDRIVARRGPRVSILDVATLAVTRQLVAADGDDLAVSADGGVLALAGSVTIVHDLRGRDEPVTLPGHDGGVHAVAVTPSGERTLVATAGDEAVIVWDVGRDEPLHVLAGAHVESLAFSPGGTRLAAGGDGVARVWDVALGNPVARLDAGPGPVRSLAFDPAGTMLAGASAGGAVRVWDVRTRAQRAALRDRRRALREQLRPRVEAALNTHGDARAAFAALVRDPGLVGERRLIATMELLAASGGL